MERRFTRREVAARARREDAAIIIDNVVYDVTRWLDEHPGGAEVLLQRAGGDATACFRAVGHSEEAERLRRRFRLGEVADEDRWQEAAEPEPAPERASAAGLLAAAGPPLLAGALAAALYAYLFS